MKKWFELVCVITVLGWASGAWGANTLIGDFEGGVDGWYEDYQVTISSAATGATRGMGALEVVASADPDAYGSNTQKPIFGNADAIEAATTPGAVVMLDVTAFAEDFPDDWGQYGLVVNCNSFYWTTPTFEDFVLDGEAHTVTFEISEDGQAAIAAAAETGSYINLGIITSLGSQGATFYIDNVWIVVEEFQDPLLPHNPDKIQDLDEVNEDVDVVLVWKAAADPNGQYEVHPDIVDEYVFMSNGTATDPNLYYVGSTGEDPGTDDPNSRYPADPAHLNLPLDATYSWAVVDAINGFEETLTIGDSINLVDPNNLIGPTWTFNTLTSLEILEEPASLRVPQGDPAPFSVSVRSLTTAQYQWFFSSDREYGGDNAITSYGGTTDTLTIPSVSATYQAYFYCRVANDATVSGGGTNPDLYTEIVSLVVERKVAEYLFEGNLSDTSGEGNDGTAFNGAVTVAGDSIEGSSALSLDGVDQYVSLGADGYPNASLIEVGGIGGGLDVGSILCWVKVTQEGGILANYNNDPNIPTGAALTIQETSGDARIFVQGAGGNVGAVNNAPAEYYNMINDGTWHLIAATWDQNDEMRLYVDTQLAQSGVTARTFNPWQYGVLVGANRPFANDRSIIGDFYGGLIDNLRIYNYVVTPEEIAQEYYDEMGVQSCIYPDFSGSEFNVDNTGSSHCKVDLADFAEFAANWLNDGFYPAP